MRGGVGLASSGTGGKGKSMPSSPRRRVYIGVSRRRPRAGLLVSRRPPAALFAGGLVGALTLLAILLALLALLALAAVVLALAAVLAGAEGPAEVVHTLIFILQAGPIPTLAALAALADGSAHGQKLVVPRDVARALSSAEAAVLLAGPRGEAGRGLLLRRADRPGRPRGRLVEAAAVVFVVFVFDARVAWLYKVGKRPFPLLILAALPLPAAALEAPIVALVPEIFCNFFALL